MKIQPLADDDAIDSILWIGNPGAYGTYGVANIISGKVSPFNSSVMVPNVLRTPGTAGR